MKKKHIITILAIVIVLIIVGVSIFMFRSPAGKAGLPTDEATSTSEVSQAPKQVALISEKSEGKYDSIDLSYPDTSAPMLSDIKKYVDITKSDFLKSVPTDANAAQYENVGEDNKYTLSMKTTIYTSSTTITYKLETYSYTGGAHGSTVDATFTYSNGKLLTLTDILVSSDSLNKLSVAARVYLKNKFAGQLEDDEINTGTTAKLDNFNVWYITDSGINFIFGQYQIGPYVFGIQEFPLSWSDADGIIKL